MALPDASPPHVDSLLGGRYRLVRRLAQGGMATVWEGYDTVLARAVAIKVLHPHLATDQLFLERFRREAVAAARLSHPNVVATFDAGSAADGAAFIVMELVRGITLRQFLTEHGALSPPLAVGIGLQITDALAHAHAAGLIHRDIKPANVLVCDNDTSGVPRIKVTDFGIAKAAEGLGLDLTRTGMVLGTPKYLSPEQIEGREPDTRADLYAFGVVLFEMIAGTAPFSGPTDMATAVQHLNSAPPRLSTVRPGVSAGLDRLVAALLAKDPDQRPSSAASVHQALLSVDTSDDTTGVVMATHQMTGVGAVTAPPTVADPVAPASLHGPWAGSLPTAVLPGPGRSDRTPTPAVPIRPGRRRRPNWPGRFVAALVVVALAVVVIVLTSRSPGSGRHPSAGATPTVPGTAVAIRDVSVFHLERNADDAIDVGKTFDGIPGTVWKTDIYFTSHFGGLRPHGFGLAITLDGRHKLHQLRVTSTTQGWSAEVYVADTLPTPPALAPWGAVL
ncbi:MAG TPA: serine/threonine-protein kinase, partial [Acidimicrobiales bacterium]|nr:serine/threonine-protein kinase [Acidimicrobiales bacterium]